MNRPIQTTDGELLQLRQALAKAASVLTEQRKGNSLGATTLARHDSARIEVVIALEHADATLDLAGVPEHLRWPNGEVEDKWKGQGGGVVMP